MALERSVGSHSLAAAAHRGVGRRCGWKSTAFSMTSADGDTTLNWFESEMAWRKPLRG